MHNQHLSEFSHDTPGRNPANPSTKAFSGPPNVLGGGGGRLGGGDKKKGAAQARVLGNAPSRPVPPRPPPPKASAKASDEHEVIDLT